MTHAYLAPHIPPDTIWPTIRAQAEALQKTEPPLAGLLQRNILAEQNISGAVNKMLCGKLASPDMGIDQTHDILTLAHRADSSLAQAAEKDLLTIMSNDPAATHLIIPFLFFKGFHALQAYRIAHWLWTQQRRHLALYFQNRISDVFGVDIHPAAKIAPGIMMDHATGIVVGETAVVEEGVLFWHDVTLGGDLMGGDRHPKIRAGAWLGAGASILGRIEIGAGARVAAGSVVLHNVAAGFTVAGVPAKIVKSN